MWKLTVLQSYMLGLYKHFYNFALLLIFELNFNQFLNIILRIETNIDI